MPSTLPVLSDRQYILVALALCRQGTVCLVAAIMFNTTAAVAITPLLEDLAHSNGFVLCIILDAEHRSHWQDDPALDGGATAP